MLKIFKQASKTNFCIIWFGINMLLLAFDKGKLFNQFMLLPLVFHSRHHLSKKFLELMESVLLYTYECSNHRGYGQGNIKSIRSSNSNFKNGTFFISKKRHLFMSTLSQFIFHFMVALPLSRQLLVLPLLGTTLLLDKYEIT